MVAGNKLHLSELIVSLRNFIRQALDLEPISRELRIPHIRDGSGMAMGPDVSGNGNRDAKRRVWRRSRATTHREPSSIAFFYA